MKKIYVANWKMYFAYHETIAFAQRYKDDLIALAHQEDAQLIVCPSYLELSAVHTIFKGTDIAVGGQDCSAHLAGAFTGQVSSLSLQQIGAQYCLVGHSEQRLYGRQSDADIAHKVFILLDHGITPILCIGETHDAYKNGETKQVLRQQLAPIIKGLLDRGPGAHLCIAYEPVWSIGTGAVPSAEVLDEVFVWLRHELMAYTTEEFPLLYGGSVSEQTLESFKLVRHLGGFLVGRASLNFQDFKKVVSYKID